MRGAAKHIVRYQADEAVLTELDSLCAAIKKNRKLESARPLDLSLKQLLSFEKLKDINKASDFLANMLMADKSICIIGYFDTDGATSTALAVVGLQALGAKKINY